MPIPDFTLDGVLPPFLGDDPGQSSELSSPHEVTVCDVIERFAISPRRCEILRGWLEHRAALRKFGYDRGFQWLDGSFVEDKLEPNDLDVVNFLYQLSENQNHDSAEEYKVIGWNYLKKHYLLDSFVINLNDPPENTIRESNYFFGLFSHQRESFLWKGIVKVRLENANNLDETALEILSKIERSFVPEKGVSP